MSRYLRYTEILIIINAIGHDMDLHNAPKQFCEQITIGFTEEFFVMALASGQSAAAYTLTPAHAKRLKQYLDKTVSDYEEKYGTINAEWNPNVKSPIQLDELSNEDTNEGGTTGNDQ